MINRKLSISIYVYLLEGNHWNEIFPSVFKEPKMGIARVMGASLLEQKVKWSRGTMIGWIHMICFHTPLYIYIIYVYIYIIYTAYNCFVLIVASQLWESTMASDRYPETSDMFLGIGQWKPWPFWFLHIFTPK